MKRLVAALAIRDRILTETPRSHSSFEAHSGAFRIKKPKEYYADYFTPFNPYPPCFLTRRVHNLALAKRMPYFLEAYLYGSPRLLSLRWNEREAFVVYMRRGNWETKFGLPPFEGASAIQDWELDRRRRS